MFQEDNVPSHTVNISKKCRKELGLDVLDWPSRSSDLSPIENISNILNDCVCKRTFPLTNLRELEVALQEEWQKIDRKTCADLCLKMHNRLVAIKENKDEPIPY
ncbi:hypothetical protein PHYBLDRAFT_112330 [Phycomyces blakesleeanus NRRL 1555(-)]|uniref:Tc1-like transposase DDE domain-containing protein n=1 Tax=Phycomyces blakesleeanus (strain ATCC 8743b / DSM 1359 / FGSC 10004 / NBRC 33097 / NRRL 1555) TaxID=763407 RepID=A0A163DX53_PHYB8|nr:hypothetical protein PHYBLDRAFT_112330 [Phycomyces blakesleeanus NRRL 1555(-)]OAD73950.1 hypothetical protein PHYBLDRAFT_112330 [Phycomyces blakesleeanus NRRL 1555(-)]|eukprot:XP_018291990.1 hypothetical protein PHYBLDRAFT_112330 [Phycomyces blakesleeanus NRRL 1555(-)]